MPPRLHFYIFDFLLISVGRCRVQLFQKIPFLLHLLEWQDRNRLLSEYVFHSCSKSIDTIVSVWFEFLPDVCIYSCRPSTMVWSAAETLPVAQILDMYQSTDLYINPAAFSRYTKLGLGLNFLFFLRQVSTLPFSMGGWFLFSKMQCASHGIESELLSSSARNVATQTMLPLVAM
jgi:hypothetical protein